MFKIFIAAIMILGAAQNALAFQKSTDSTITSPATTLNFSNHDVHDIISVQLSEKQSLKFGANIKDSNENFADYKKEAIFMAKYKFSF